MQQVSALAGLSLLLPVALLVGGAAQQSAAERAMSTAHAAYVRNGPTASADTRSAIGQAFDIRIKPVEGVPVGAMRSPARWIYAQGELSVSFDAGVLGPVDLPEKASYLAFDYAGAQTAGGAIPAWTVDALAVLSQPGDQGAVSREFLDSLSDAMKARMAALAKRSFAWSQPMDEAAARALAGNLELQLRGRIAALPASDRPTACVFAAVRPSPEAPVSANIQRCVLGARIDEIVLTDKRTGAVLKSWGMRD